MKPLLLSIGVVLVHSLITTMEIKTVLNLWVRRTMTGKVLMMLGTTRDVVEILDLSVKNLFEMKTKHEIDLNM